MPEFGEVERLALNLSGLDAQTWAAEDEVTRLYWYKQAEERMRAALGSQGHSGLTLTTADETGRCNAARNGRISRFVLVRMEQVGEPVYTPDGQSLVHVRLPWFRETDGCWAVSVKDLVG
jgi:hypothetical protein